MINYSMGSKRSPGLDLARTCAIIGVLAAHATLFFEPLGYDRVSLLPVHIWGGFFGVELFFALSGFLIGQILFRYVLTAHWHASYIFLIRRWLRLLPAYYIILFLLFLVSYIHGWTPDNSIDYLLFLQNARPEYAQFFPVSWSLSIEQWAYIWTLLALLPGQFIGKVLQQRFGCHRGAEVFWGGVLVCGIAVSLIARCWYAGTQELAWDNDFRKQVVLRLDAVLFGVLIAWIKFYASSLYKFFARRESFLFLFLSLSCILLNFDVRIYDEQNNFFYKTLAFSLIDGIGAFMLCFLDSNEKIKKWLSINSLKGKFVFYGSIYAYSLYLIHLFIFLYVQRKELQLASVSWETAVICLCAAVLLSLCAAICLYHIVEKPCMRLRKYFVFK